MCGSWVAQGRSTTPRVGAAATLGGSASARSVTWVTTGPAPDRLRGTLGAVDKIVNDLAND
jgi:hypothetical protein